MTGRIFLSIFLSALAVLTVSFILIFGVLYSHTASTAGSELKIQLGLAAAAVETEGKAYLEDLDPEGCRITWIDADGTVLYESTKAGTSSMENHLSREEVRQAFRTGYGQSQRYSSTMMENSLYAAKLLSDGTVLRMSVTRDSVFALLLSMLRQIVAVLLFAALFSLFLAYRFSRRVVRPLNAIDLDHPEEVIGYDELSPLLGRIRSQQKQLDIRRQELAEKQKELDTILGNMNEGMILLQKNGNIISINTAAKEIIGAEQVTAGSSILTISRNLDFQNAVQSALRGTATEKIISFEDNQYQLTASPVIKEALSPERQKGEADPQDKTLSKAASNDEAGGKGTDTDVKVFDDKSPDSKSSDDKSRDAKNPGDKEFDVQSSEKEIQGAVVVLFDVTERMQAEQMRREFSANVSHELKTPLHSISGYAELIKNGMAGEKDIQPFSEKIYNEAQRTIRLVEDIISLSHLDEGAEDMKFENTDLHEVALGVVNDIALDAEKAGVSLEVTGESAYVNGIPGLLTAIISNLCDNSIKYNHQGGRVTIDTRSDDGGAVLTVSDTGIGIAPADQKRIFERFYRVDKSHSRAIGGTGLGLSIVKHAVMVHSGRIDISSKVGEGTSITVTFPGKSMTNK